MDYPDDRDVLETFECDAPVSFRSAFFLGFPFHSPPSDTAAESYRYSLMLRMLKALTSSTKMSLRLDDEGLLSLQFLMPSPRARGALGPQANAAEAFVEFRVRAPSEARAPGR
jgi:cell cycle checkpoint protein